MSRKFTSFLIVFVFSLWSSVSLWSAYAKVLNDDTAITFTKETQNDLVFSSLSHVGSFYKIEENSTESFDIEEDHFDNSENLLLSDFHFFNYYYDSEISNFKNDEIYIYKNITAFSNPLYIIFCDYRI